MVMVSDREKKSSQFDSFQQAFASTSLTHTHTRQRVLVVKDTWDEVFLL